MIDSHCHIYFDSFDEDREDAFTRGRDAGVEHFVVVGIDVATSERARSLRGSRPDVTATAGIHPNDSGAAGEEDWARLEELLATGDFGAVGETGLDYYRDRTPKTVQQEALRRHFDLARRFELPVVIHCRDAWSDLLDLVESEASGLGGVMHCFSGGTRELERSLVAGFDVSFAGPLTYPRSEELREACRQAPIDRLHVETDCPFLPPQGHRGQRNEPAFMRLVVDRIAALHDLDPAAVEAATAANSRRLFGIADRE